MFIYVIEIFPQEWKMETKRCFLKFVNQLNHKQRPQLDEYHPVVGDVCMFEQFQ